VVVKKLPEREDMVGAIVFVPESSSDYFMKKVEEYRDKNTKTKKPKPKNEALISRLENVQIGKVTSLFTDNPALFPEDERKI
jgi:hypothetical protein